MAAETTVGLLIALVSALGGAVALLKYAESRRRRLVAHFSLAGSDLVLETQTLRLRNDRAGPRARFDLDLKNDSETAIAIHEVHLTCDRIETIAQPVVVALRWADHTSDADRKALIAAEQLQPLDQTLVFSRFRAPSRETLTRLTAHPGVAEAFIDAVGEPHRAFESANEVTFDLRPPQTTYSARVARTVAERDTLTIPIVLEWSAALRGHAKLQVAYEGDRRLDVAEFDFELPSAAS